MLLAQRWRLWIDVSRSSCLAALSWGQRCYVNWLLFRKWGRSPSYEQSAPPPSCRCHTLAAFQDVFHLHSWFLVAELGGQRQLLPPQPPLSSAPIWVFKNDALALPPCRQINQWKMSLPECRFVGVGVAAAAASSLLCIWFYACLWAAAEPWVTALLPWLHSDWFSPSELSFLVCLEKRFARKTAKRKETEKLSTGRLQNHFHYFTSHSACFHLCEIIINDSKKELLSYTSSQLNNCQLLICNQWCRSDLAMAAQTSVFTAGCRENKLSEPFKHILSKHIFAFPPCVASQHPPCFQCTCKPWIASCCLQRHISKARVMQNVSIQHFIACIKTTRQNWPLTSVAFYSKKKSNVYHVL